MKRVRTVIISSLPRIIRMLRTTLLASGILAKLLIGPTVPRPGPIPAIHVATELADVMTSDPLAVRNSVPIRNVNR